MTTLPHDSEPVQGCWKGARTGSKRTALVACPDCGDVASLSGHQIMEDGTVQPSLVCPHDGCNFHDYIKLEGWKP